MTFDWDNPKFAEQIPIDQALAEALIAFIPEPWRSAELRLTWEAGSSAVTLQVQCPDTGEGWTVSQEIIDTALLLGRHRDKYNLGWESAQYTVRLNDTGEWQARADFQYPAKKQTRRRPKKRGNK